MLTAQITPVNIVVPIEAMSVAMPLGKDASTGNKQTMTKKVVRDA